MVMTAFYQSQRQILDRESAGAGLTLVVVWLQC